MSLRTLLPLLAALILYWAPASPSLAAVDPAPDEAGSPRQMLVLLRMPPPHFRSGRDYGGSYGDGPGLAARKRLAGSIAARAGVSLVEAWPMPLVGVDCFVMEVPEDRSFTQAYLTIATMPGVAWVQPVREFFAQQQPDRTADPLFLAQPSAAQWHLADLHRVATGKGVRVAVIDSQVDARHPDLDGQIAMTADLTGKPILRAEQHGTAVAGIIAAVAGNGIGIVGIAPKAEILALRACWQRAGSPHVPSTTLCNSLSLAKALHRAVEGRADIVNLSLSGPPDLLLGRLVDVALDRGIAVVAAVDPGLADGGFPASHPRVIPVSATAREVERAYLAPGSAIPTTQGGGRWTVVSGSSFAAAHVTGLLALMRSRGPPLRSSRLVLTTAADGLIDSCASLGADRSCGCPAGKAYAQGRCD